MHATQTSYPRQTHLENSVSLNCRGRCCDKGTDRASVTQSLHDGGDHKGLFVFALSVHEFLGVHLANDAETTVANRVEVSALVSANHRILAGFKVSRQKTLGFADATRKV